MEKKPFSPADLFQFDRMVAPTVLKIVYWLGLIGIGIYMLIALFAAIRMMDYNFSGGFGMLLLAIVGALFGTLFWRILIEIYMVFFNIHNRVTEIRDMMAKDKDSDA